MGPEPVQPRPAPSSPITVGDDRESPFHVPQFLHVLGGLVQRHLEFWLWLGRLESRLLADQLNSLSIQAPIYVAGLARSGTTLLHQVIATHPAVATHRMKDYPMLFTPYWWRRATANIRPGPPRERPHRDGVMITTESPDALEEMLWMAFFRRCHDPTICQVLGAKDKNRAFERFYFAHIRKLLLAENVTRYAAKANYHVARLAYLARLFPDAKFILPIRAPTDHIASLMRQHRWFSQGERKHPPALAYMQRSGHFEFGLDRRPMHLGDGQEVQAILKAWSSGDEVFGLAKHWDMVYRYLAELLANDEQVRKATLVVRFDELCADPATTLRAVFAHCALPNAESIVAGLAPSVRPTTPYDRNFSAHELDVIREETAATAALWGY
jgi:hypothetical protein